MDAPREDRSIGQLFGDLSRQLTTLIRQELDLAKAELRTGAKALASGAAMAAAGGVVVHAAALVLLAAIVLFLVDAGIRPSLAALIVAVVVGAIGLLLVQVGRGRLAHTDLAPTRTVDTLRQDAEWAKERLP